VARDYHRVAQGSAGQKTSLQRRARNDDEVSTPLAAHPRGGPLGGVASGGRAAAGGHQPHTALWLMSRPPQPAQWGITSGSRPVRARRGAVLSQDASPFQWITLSVRQSLPNTALELNWGTVVCARQSGELAALPFVTEVPSNRNQSALATWPA